MHAQADFFKDLFMNSTALTMVTDREGYIIVFNNAASELLVGKTSDEARVEGRNIIDFVIDEDKAKIIRLWKESVQEKKELSYPVRMKSFDGRSMYLLITGKPFIRDGEVVCFQYQALDIVDQKVQEQNLQQTASLETVGQLAGAFAHDFNNLLTVINGYSEIMLSTIDQTHPFYGKVCQICQAGSQASALTQKILDFSRKTRSSHQEVDINRELAEQEAILKHIIGANIDLVIERKEGLGKVRIDSIQFSKMLLNLMLNAKEAMAKGGEIRITTDTILVNESNGMDFDFPGRGEYLLLTVKDTGVGMSPEIARHIFDPFFSTRDAGKGMGLWTVSNILKSAGGAIAVESFPGSGTTFRILLPFIRDVAPTTGKAAENEAGCAVGSKTILVVEDDDTVRDLVSEILRQKGHHILTAINGGDAMQLARQYEDRIDLLITDMVMRRIDGIMLAKKMQTILPGIRVMLMSGYGNDVIREEEIRGFTFLQKPFLPNELIQKVSNIFSAQSS